VSTLRERRRDQTLKEIAEAALRLFDAQGYKQTTVEDVARAAGVSSRTVFRYFATKSELVFGWFPDLEEFVKSLPLEGVTPSNILRGIEQTVQRVLDDFGEIMDNSTAAEYTMFRRLISQDADLRAAMAEWEQRLVDLARARILDQFDSPDTDPSVNLVLELVTASVRVALDDWVRTPGSSLAAHYAQTLKARDALLAGR
jgi:AcrR family transcriptional regulator